ncbi:carbohydrate ABC transporter permease [Neobacillus mesonae]|nr:carbohydrate ABC transporter permease [Neobacillus mesonae]
MKNRWEASIATIFLSIGSFIMALPFIWMILNSFKTEKEALAIPPTLFPETFSFQSYLDLFQRLDFGIYLMNTMIIVLFSMLGLLLDTMAGYAFSKFRFRGNRLLFVIVLATMMIPGQVKMIPMYIIISEMNLTNTMAGIVLPGLASAFNIFLVRQFMTTIPDELLEAGRLDGAGEFRIFSQLVLSMSKPILAVQAIFTFIGAWNSFLWPLIVANDDALFTLSVGMSLLKGQYSTDFALQMAGATFMVIPVLIVYVCFQKYIVQGFNLTGIK